MKPTGITKDTTYYAFIITKYSSLSYYRKVTIHVKACNISRWSKWSEVTLNLWSIWDEGYQLSIDKLEWNRIGQSMSSQAKVIETISQAILTAAVILSILASLMSLSSPNGLWIAFNQFQLILLIPIIGVTVPYDVIQSIVGFKFVSFSFSFLPTKYFWFIYDLQDKFKFEQSNSYFELLELSSTSTFYNFYVMLLIILCIFIFHSFFQILWLWIKKKINSEKFIKLLKWINAQFNFNVYTRLFLESYLFLSLSLVNEVNIWNSSSINETVSLWIWLFLLFSTWNLTIIISIYDFIKTEIKEFKKSKLSRLYIFVFMIRRLASVIIIVVPAANQVILRSALFLIIQVLVLIFVMLVRPYEKTQNNISEIANELYFTGMSAIVFSQSL